MQIHTKYRDIVSDIPTPESLKVFKDLEKYEARSMHGGLPVLWTHASDFSVWDLQGNKFIDFTSGIFVANTGHSNPYITRALHSQISSDLLYSYTFATEVRARFLKKLIGIMNPQFEKAFLMSSGTEATECAIKLIRMRGLSINPNKNIIISFRGSMHGRTIGAEMLKGTESWMGYQDPNIYHMAIPFPWEPVKYLYLDDEDCDFNEDRIAGFIIESYIGWSSYFYPPNLMQELCKFAREHNAIVCFDEIQSGFGRTGELFAYKHYDIEPDMLCLGKGLSGSLPLSAVVSSAEIMDLPEKGSMSSTFSANPLSCAASLANLEYLEDFNLVSESRRKGIILHQKLKELQSKFPDKIRYVFGNGLVAGLVLSNKFMADIICDRAMVKGLLLVYTGRESIKIGPPLTIQDEALQEGLDVLEEAIQEL